MITRKSEASITEGLHEKYILSALSNDQPFRSHISCTVDMPSGDASELRSQFA